MSTPILATKLQAPPPRPRIVHRPRLIQQLNMGLHRRLTLISATAGFGKTTLVREWVTEVERPVAWLSLDEDDSDSARFLAYVIAAIQTVWPELGAGTLGTLQSPQPPPHETMLISLLNEIAALAEPFILVLDDYQLIDSPSVDSVLTFLLDHLPPQLQLVIVTREDPPLPLARYRMQDQLTELRDIDLRFTATEAAEYLNQTMRLDLAVDEIEALEHRTEGWIAGLQLAAISLQGQRDAAAFVKSFTGSHRFIMDYLVEEVLEQQSDDVQTFLLQTAVLSRLTGPLCDALTGQDGGYATLEMLDHANLFIIPLDEERRWYRYHHLFADLLLQRLRQTGGEQIQFLHRRASLWWEQQEYFDEAIQHALLAEDFPLATRQIERVAEAVWLRGTDNRLRRWLARLPTEHLCTKPQLCIYHAWYLLAAGELEAAQRMIQAIEQASENGAAKYRGQVATLLAFVAFYLGDVEAIIQHARQALADLPRQELSWRSTAIHLLGDGYDFRGEMEEAYRARLEAVAASKASGDALQIMITNLKLAVNLRHRGYLTQVTRICRQQQAFAQERGMGQTVVAGWLLAIWGETLAELNDIGGAIHKAHEGVGLCERGGDLAMLGWSYLCLTRVLFSSGDVAGAEEVVQKLNGLALRSFVPPWIMNLNEAWQARLWLEQEKLEATERWVERRGLGADHDPDYAREAEYTVFARILIAQNELNTAIKLLQRQFKAAQAGGRIGRMIELLTLQARAFMAAEEQAQALAMLQQALILAEPGGFIRSFVDEGPRIIPLLSEARARGSSPTYPAKLTAALDAESSNRVDMPTAPSAPRLIEPLSARELEVLQLIAQGFSNHEIGERLSLALNTVKGHNRNIFGKLQVKRRTEAVAHARNLGLL